MIRNQQISDTFTFSEIVEAVRRIHPPDPREGYRYRFLMIPPLFHPPSVAREMVAGPTTTLQGEVELRCMVSRNQRLWYWDFNDVWIPAGF